jgi:hypothetical protein
MNSRLLALLALGTLAALVACPSVEAEPVLVRFTEGVARGFLSLRSANGDKLADGELVQVPRPNGLEGHLSFRFADGSLYDETVLYSQRRVFTHTGWREIEGEWVYLTANGAVGREGFEVDLGPELARYRLPRHAEGPAGAMRASLRLLDPAPLTVTAPLWAGTFRAPLASALPLDLALWIEAQTGHLKSTLAALFACHYGNFDRRNLSAPWASTANQL